MASFIIDPAPWLPTCSTRLHICSSSGLAISKSSALPPTKPINLPSFAGPMLPPTGHSKYFTPTLDALSAITACLSGETVLISMMSLPGAGADKSPFAEKYTSSSACSLVNKQITMSDC